MPSSRAARIDSVSPGTDSRYRVSWIARQSSSLTSTALLRGPVMVTGWDSSFTWSISRYSFERAVVAFTAVILNTSPLSVRHRVRAGQKRVWPLTPCRPLSLSYYRWVVSRENSLLRQSSLGGRRRVFSDSPVVTMRAYGARHGARVRLRATTII